MKTNRVKNTFLNAFVMIVNTGLMSILSLISTNLILKNYGSDFNGVVATANQFVNLILIVEGGFTTAINVALFKPFVDGNQKKINKIMSAAKNVFFKIGLIFLLIGIIISLVYPIFIKSDLPYLTIFLIFLMVMVGTGYNLIFVYRNQIMFQVSQKEYIYSFFAAIVNVCSSITTILLAYNKVDMLIIRLIILIYIIVNGFIIYILFKKTFPKIKSDKPDYKSIKGTKDIMVQKFTSVVYLSSPLLFISTFISTSSSSVYSVYSSIYNIVKSVITAIIAAPVNGFGQLLSNGKKKDVLGKFETYEYIILVLSAIMLSSVLSVIVPFIKIYTAKISDINYVSYSIAILLALIALFEVIHIPSGHIINVSGNFKAAKKIQLIAVIILVVLLFIGQLFFGIIGILVAILITNIILASMEIYFTHIKIFESSLKKFLCMFFLNFVLMIIIVLFVFNININITSYFEFFVLGGIIFVIDSIVILLVNYIFFKNDFKEITSVVKKFLKK